MTHCSSGVHDRPTPCVRAESGRSKSSPPRSQPIESGKIEEKYGVDFGARDALLLGTLLGRTKIDSLSVLLGRGLGGVKES